MAAPAAGSGGVPALRPAQSKTSQHFAGLCIDAARGYVALGEIQRKSETIRRVIESLRSLDGVSAGPKPIAGVDGESLDVPVDVPVYPFKYRGHAAKGGPPSAGGSGPL